MHIIQYSTFTYPLCSNLARSTWLEKINPEIRELEVAIISNMAEEIASVGSRAGRLKQ
jgi:hypothetical protein